MVTLIASLALIAVVVFAIFFGFQTKEMLTAIAILGRQIRDLRHDLDEIGATVDGLNRQETALIERLNELDRTRSEVMGEVAKVKASLHLATSALNEIRTARRTGEAAAGPRRERVGNG